MKYKSLVCIIAVVSMLASAFLAMPAIAQSGPKMPNLLVHIYLSDVAEFEAFQANTGADAIDLLDWPLPKDKVDLWQTPAYSSVIELKDYSDIGIYEVDINHQRWPTGVTEPRVYDELSDSFKHYYDGTNIWDVTAKEFRKGIAYLSDREGWKNRILKGYGTVQHTSIPVPACAGYTDYAGLELQGLLYHYNPATAAATFDAAGFTQGTTPNPYYDPATPASAHFLRTDPRYGGDLQPLQFFIRMDDVLRRDVGRELTAQMRKAGIQVNAVETDRTVCYNQAMVIYDFHLYTGGWSETPDTPIDNHGLWHSSQYWGGTETSYFGGVGWSGNYDGFCDEINDGYLEIGRYSGDFAAIKEATLRSQERQQELVNFICAYSRLAVTAYKKGWEGFIDFRGSGPQTPPWSHMNAEWIGPATPQNPLDNEIDWALKSSLSGPNVVTTEWLWDAYITALLFDTMITRNPYDLSVDYGQIAESWVFDPDDPAGPSCLFTMRPGLTFHNGDPITPEDVEFSMEFTKACGPGVAFGYSRAEIIDHVDIYPKDPSLGPLDVKVYLTQPSYWGVHDVGYIPIMDKAIWAAHNATDGWEYLEDTVDFMDFPNRLLVRNYNPWEADHDGDGDSDFEEDGSAAWIYRSHVPAGPIDTATALYFEAFPNYAVSQQAVSDYLGWSYHMIGDVNGDWTIDASDGQAIQRALGTDTGFPWGTGWDEYNQQADINFGNWDMIGQVPDVIGDTYVNFLDLGKWGLNFGSPT